MPIAANRDLKRRLKLKEGQVCIGAINQLSKGRIGEKLMEGVAIVLNSAFETFFSTDIKDSENDVWRN